MIRTRPEVTADERGFTLMELLVVVIVIGVLATIAIPVFVNQRQKGWDAAVQSDLRSAAIAQETALTANGRYLTAIAGGASVYDDLTDFGFHYSSSANYDSGTASVAAVADGPNTYCLQARSASNQTFSFSSLLGLRRGPCPVSAPY